MKETKNKVLDVEILTDEVVDEKAAAKEEKKRLKEEKAKAKAEKKAEKAEAKAAAKAQKAAEKEAKEAEKVAAKAAKEAMMAEDAAEQEEASEMQMTADVQEAAEPVAENGEAKAVEKKEKLSLSALLSMLKDGLAGGGKGSRSIMQTLFLAFMVPVVMMIILGVVSYNMASSGMLSKYSESAVSTVSAVGNYCELVCDSLSTKALELITNDDVGGYYNKGYRKQSAEALEQFRNSKSILSTMRSTNSYIYSYSIIPDEGGSFLSSLTGAMTETPLADFNASTEGQYFVNNEKAQNAWMGYHSYIDGAMNNSAVTDYSMVYYQRFAKSEAILMMDISMETTNEMLTQMDFGDNSIKALVSPDGRETVLIQGKEDQPIEETYFVGQDFFEESKTWEAADSKDVRVGGKKYVYIASPVGKTGAMICALIPQKNLLGQVSAIKYVIIVMVILAAVAALVTGITISTGISKAVRSMTKGLSKVADGDLTEDFETKRKDEFKVLTGSLNSMLESMRGLMVDMKQFGAKVTNLSGDVSDKTGMIHISMQDISRAMDEVALGVQSQAEDTEVSNEKMITFSENINSVAEKTVGMQSTADKAIGAVEEGKVIVQDLSQKSDTTVSLTRVLVNDINDVQKSSEEIKGFVNIINSIAEQTNLLSLNASIEAARAGEAGRGFAVVAEEIRKLAEQSKASANKIKAVVEVIGSTTDKTTESAKEAEAMVNDQAKALAETVEVFGRIHECVGDLVDNIHVITALLEKSVEEEEQVQYAIQNISSVSEEVAASTQEVTATINEQVSVIDTLKEEVEALRADAKTLGESIDRFKV